MPPRFAYWTIIVDGQPTAFRAAQLEELRGVFNRLKQKHPSAELMWFQNGKLWRSRLDAREAMTQARREEERKKRAAEYPPRDRKWRPGGTHRDPRQKYIDAKKAKWTRYKQNVRAATTARRTKKAGDDE